MSWCLRYSWVYSRLCCGPSCFPCFAFNSCSSWTLKMRLVVLHRPHPLFPPTLTHTFLCFRTTYWGWGCWKRLWNNPLTPDLRLCPHRQVHWFSHCHELKGEWRAQREGASALGRGRQQQWWLWPRVWHGTAPLPWEPKSRALCCPSAGRSLTVMSLLEPSVASGEGRRGFYYCPLMAFRFQMKSYGK